VRGRQGKRDAVAVVPSAPDPTLPSGRRMQVSRHATGGGYGILPVTRTTEEAMTIGQLQKEVLGLTPEERTRFAEWIIAGLELEAELEREWHEEQRQMRRDGLDPDWDPEGGAPA
jgi:hypothetical protein